MTRTLNEIAEEAKKLERECGIDLDAVMNKLTQELGEFNDAVQKFRRVYSRSEGDIEGVKDEAGDLALNSASILYELGINPDELPIYAEATLGKFRERKEAYKKR